MSKAIDKTMSDLQKDFDFSYVVAEVKGKQLTEEQHKAKEHTLLNLVLSETPENEARLQEVIEYRKEQSE